MKRIALVLAIILLLPACKGTGVPKDVRVLLENSYVDSKIYEGKVVCSDGNIYKFKVEGEDFPNLDAPEDGNRYILDNITFAQGRISDEDLARINDATPQVEGIKEVFQREGEEGLLEVRVYDYTNIKIIPVSKGGREEGNDLTDAGNELNILAKKYLSIR